MPEQFDFIVLPEDSTDEDFLRTLVQSRIPGKRLQHIRLIKRSIDSRQRQVKINLRVEVFLEGDTVIPFNLTRHFPEVHGREEVVIAGAGPAGLFAALRLIELGYRPVIIERGRDVQARRRDLAAIHRDHLVNPDSNYCFGEGGAGTYSDGKLYTRSTKRGDVRSILDTLIQFGAPEDIRIDAHPHIGTNKLPKIITAIRETILQCGGAIRFGERMTGLEYETHDGIKFLKGIRLHRVSTGVDEVLPCKHLILATGHSARGVFTILHSMGLSLEFKAFALGVRVEHPQALIDQIQYHCELRGDSLPPAPYSLVSQVENRGVFSFCMCPGGIIAPCATSPGEVVTNGWSPSKRNNPWANSGIVTQVGWEDVKDFHSRGPLAGIAFQESVEKVCWEAGGRTQAVPAQRLTDFISGKTSSSLPNNSYQPGTISCRVDQLLPGFVSNSLKQAFLAFERSMPGYLTAEAVVVAPESRTSSPVRIPRDGVTCEHPEIVGLFPCGEGAGYAGGIVSAAIDGEKVALAVAARISGSMGN